MSVLPYFPPRISLALLPTPLSPLQRLSTQFDQQFWIKRDDLTGSLLTGNKVRKLEYVLADAQAEGCDTVITCGGVQSNHCRATVISGAQLGLKVHLLLRGERPEEFDGNLLLDELAGACISFYRDDDYVRNLPKLAKHWCDEYARQGRKAYFIPTGASNGVGLWGYLQAAEELIDDCNQAGFTPDAVVIATGSGGTQGGLTLGMHLLGVDVPVYGMAVCDSSQYFQRKVVEDISEWYSRWAHHVELNVSLLELVNRLRVNTIDSYIGPGYAQGYPELYDCIRSLARTEGVVLDPVYTGKAFYGMLQESRQGAFREMENIVFVHTGGIYGLYPHRAAFAQT